MNDKLFAQLVQSIKQAGQIRRGTKRAARRTTIGAPDVQRIRSRLGLSQDPSHGHRASSKRRARSTAHCTRLDLESIPRPHVACVKDDKG